jgi:hypothetical protein
MRTVERFRLRRGCLSKKKFDSKEEALWAMEDMKMKKVIKPELRPYLCENCKKIHLGHYNAEYQNRQWLNFVNESSTMTGIKRYKEN